MTIRQNQIEKLKNATIYDVIIIGGGSTGLGSAVEAAYKGLNVALFEKYDFAQGTSSKSTKLLHGGVRYLAQGNISLVFAALRERGHIMRNAAHLCRSQDFIIPVFSFFEKYFYLIGLKIYDLLAGNLSLGKTKSLNRSETMALLPNIKSEKLYGGVMYKDGAFDDANFAIELALKASDLGATIVNHMEVINIFISKENLLVVEACDRIEKKNYIIQSKTVINATGVFAANILKLCKQNLFNKVQVVPAQGTHIVVDKKHFDTSAALMIPKTTDGRVLFAVPFYDKVIIGTTDMLVERASIEPTPSDMEIGFIIENFNRYASIPIERSDILSKFAGLRPLVKKEGVGNTSKLSRDHIVYDHGNGMVTITGGKWTTYRKMAEDVVAFIAKKYDLTINKKSTKELKIPHFNFLSVDNKNSERLTPECTYTVADVVHAYEHAFVVKVDDFLARRTRLQLLDAKAALACSEKVIEVIAKLRNQSSEEIANEKIAYQALISNYLPS
jgi:glycerol-3-phosphate dehydrogenase